MLILVTLTNSNNVLFLKKRSRASQTATLKSVAVCKFDLFNLWGPLRVVTSTKYNQLNCVTLHPLCAKMNNNETLVCLEKVEFANMRQITRPHYHPLRSCVRHKCVSYGKCITRIKDDLSAVLLNFCQFLKLLTFSSSGYSELLVIFFISFFL